MPPKAFEANGSGHGDLHSPHPRATTPISIVQSAPSTPSLTHGMPISDQPDHDNGDLEMPDAPGLKAAEKPEDEGNDMHDGNEETDDLPPPPSKRPKSGSKSRSKSGSKSGSAPKPKAKATRKPKAAPKSKAARKPKAKANNDPLSSSESIEQDLEEQSASHGSEPERRTKSVFNHQPGYNATLPPLKTIKEIYTHLGGALIDSGFDKFLDTMDGRPLKVGTFCSGTESPILAMKMLKEVFSATGYLFNFQQLISAEIVPEKAAFIERNFHTPMIARDITECISQAMKDRVAQKEGLPPKKWKLTTAYGGEAEVPGDLDVLIAGFSCKDFSKLNNKRQGLNDKGESGDTFFAICEYVDKHPPKMVILENVNSAPWIKADSKKPGCESIEYHLDKLGYSSVYIKCDTKEHYLPHTRQRGYMVCILRSAFKAGSQKLDDLVGSFGVKFQSLKRPASVPIESMLLDFDSPLLKTTAQVDTSGRKRSVVQWARCKLGHQDYSMRFGLGESHPITHWASNGSKRLPDFHQHTPSLTERTMDTLDKSHLRNILFKKIDDRYQNRLLELSQNVFRVEDVIKVGIVGCVIPNNQLFLTKRGGRLRGIEALVAQGYDPYQVDIEMLSETLLHSMSGNAMTSTVVGTFTFAALMHFVDVFDFEGRPRQLDVAEVALEHDGGQLLVSSEAHPAQYEPIPVEELISLAKITRRLCICEGREAQAQREFQICRDCHTTSCVKCGQNPTHNYEPLALERESPLVFARTVRKSLPYEIHIEGLFSTITEPMLKDFALYCKDEIAVIEDDMPAVVALLTSVLKSAVVFQSSRRAEFWEMIYESPEALLKLRVSDSSAEWELYANVPHEPLGSKKGIFFRKTPIARMRPKGDDVMFGEWELFLPQKRLFRATITSNGNLQKSFENERGLLDYAYQFVHSNVNLEVTKDELYDSYFEVDISGRYNRKAECGQAWNSLHVKTCSTSGPPLFLFFHHSPWNGNPMTHHFSLSSDVSRKRHAEDVRVYADLPSSWKQPVVTAQEGHDGCLIIEDVPILEYRGSVIDQIEIEVGGRWVSVSDHQVSLSRKLVHYKGLPENLAHLHGHCGQKRVVFEASADLAFSADASWLLGKWTIVSRSNSRIAWKDFGYILKKKLVQEGHREDDFAWIEHTDDIVSCASCFPPRPKMLWMLGKTGKPVPREDPEMASAHEKAVKSTPAPIVAMFRLSGRQHLEFKISIDPTTLVHQAKAMLSSATGRSSPKGTLESGLSASYRLVTDDENIAHMPKQFRVESTSSLVPDADISPPNSPFRDFSTKPDKLYAQQQKALTWMLQQENSPRTFIQKELCEGYITEIGYRLEGVATQDICVAGGILAQAVGFGKTILILSIIAQRLRDVELQVECSEVAGAVPTKATLILVPDHLVGQWEGEVKTFMNVLYKQKGKLIVIKTTPKLRGLTVADIQSAYIVVVGWKVYTNSAYLNLLSSFAGLAAPDDKASPRAQRDWYQNALKRVEEHIDELNNNLAFTTNPASFTAFLKQKYAAHVEETSKLEAYMPSVHLIGAKYVSAEQRELDAKDKSGEKRKRQSKETAKAKATNAEPSCLFNFDAKPRIKKDGKVTKVSPVLGNLNYVLLEFFKWGRIVVDEYTYANSRQALTMEYLKCFNIWLLSGTPSLGAFHQVKTIANLLGIYLGRDEYVTMQKDVFKQKTRDFTKSELFAAYKQSPTTAWQRTRWQHAQDFLNLYMRQDEVDVNDVKMSNNRLAVKQSASEAAMYMELNDHVMAHDFVLTGIRFAEDDKAKQIKAASSGCEDGKVALFLRASYFGITSGKKEAPMVDPSDPDVETEEPEVQEEPLDVHNDDAEDAEILEENVQVVEEPVEILASNALLMCEKIANIRSNEYQQTLTQVSSELMKGYWLMKMGDQTNDSCDQFKNWLGRATKNLVGDHETTNDIRRVYEQVIRDYHPKVWMRFFRKADDKNKERDSLPTYPIGNNMSTGKTHLTCLVANSRQSTSSLNRLCENLVVRKRSLRVFQMVRNIQQGMAMECSKCCKKTPPSDLTLLGHCGHLLCGKCGVTSYCGVMQDDDECNAAVAGYQRIPCASLGVQSASDVSSEFGSKMDTIVNLISGKLQVGATAIGPDDRVLVFVHFNDTFLKLQEALKAAKITHACLAGSKASNILKDFQDIRKSSVQVLIMIIGDQSASGSNLTIARHLIFVQPHYTTGSSAQQSYESAMTQAIGRSRRHNQKQVVNVYELITENTIEVDYYEHRNRCTLRRLDPASDEVEEVAWTSDEVAHGPLSSAISGAMQFDS